MKSRQILKGQYDELGKFMCTQYLKKHDLFKLKDEIQKKVSDLMNEEMPDLVKQAYKAYPGYFELKTFQASNLVRLFEMHSDDKPDNKIRDDRFNYSGQQRSNWSQKRVDVSNYIYRKLKEKGLEGAYGSYQPYHAGIIYDLETNVKKSDTDLSSLSFFAVPLGNICESNGNQYWDSDEWRKLVEYLGEHQNILDVVVEYLIEYGKYRNFVKSLSCAFSTITTTNMLKNEIPEAYEYFYSKYGKEYEEQDKREAAYKKKEKKAQCDKIEALRASLS